MTVFFDIEPILGYPAGIPIYAVELLRAIQQRPDAPRLVAAYATMRPSLIRDLRERTRQLGLDIPLSWVPLPGRIADRIGRLPWHLARPKLPPPDLVHVTSCLPPNWLRRINAPMVQTVYDLGFVRHPDAQFARGTGALNRRSIASALQHSAAVLTISEFTKREIVDLLDFPADRIHVTPLATQWPDADPAATEADARLLGDLDLTAGRYFVSVGTLSPRKNYGNLLTAFGRFREHFPDASLVIVGQVGWGVEALVSALAAGVPGVRWIRSASSADLQILYRQARGSFLVSRYEGFGIPVLEAMACGCPVCYATGSSLGEVAGDAGIAVNPDDLDGMRDAFVALWEDSDRRRQLGRFGVERARQFSWHRTADLTLAAYRSVTGMEG